MPGSPATAGPRIGQDEWVARSEERRGGRGGWLGTLEARLQFVPWWAWLILFVAVVALLPLGFDSGYVRRVAFDTVIFMMLALGLNVVVGWGGLLDLGYVAFYGVGAYTYAFLSADRYDLHLPVYVSIPAAAIVGGIVGLLVGLPSRRLSGDYLAIVTLFFFQIFLTVSNNSESIFGHNVAGGPNGILNVQPLSLFGHDLPVSTEGIFNVAYLYVALAFFVFVFVALRFANVSRTGRAWRSLREDSLAAELMGMPVNWLKLMAFAFGAGVAALTGTLVTALNGSVFPQTFEFPLLITIYTMVILGGAGSQAGVVIGAIGISVLLEVLREPGDSRFLFYAVVLAGLIGALRFTRRLAFVLVGTLVFGVALHVLAGAIDGSWIDGAASGGGRLGEWANEWVVVPTSLASWVVAGLLHRPGLGGAGTDGGARPAAARAARADALPGGVRLGERHAREAGADALRHPRRDPDRRHDRPAGGHPRREARGDRLSAAAPTLLELRSVSMAFGGLWVIDGLDLDVREGEIVSVIGPNGAGKTTLFNLVTGIYEPTSGDIRFEGQSIVGLEPHQITNRGIARTFQTLRLFLNMSVRENVMAAAYGHTKAGVFRAILRTPGQRREEREIRELAERRLAFFGERLMGYRWDQPAYSLSYANRRRLEIARATATNPRLLLLDEPAAGMNPVETHEITELIAQAPHRGRLHDPRDRARHARRRRDLGPRDRARPRGQDRGGIVRRRSRPIRESIEAYLGTKAAETK